jgi:hypothetical protein
MLVLSFLEGGTGTCGLAELISALTNGLITMTLTLLGV